MRIIEKQLQKIGFIKARYKKIDIILMVILPILASVLVLALNSNNLVLSTFLFFGLPAMYLSFRKPRIAWKGLLFATIFAIPLGAVTDYLAEVSGAWFIPMTTFIFQWYSTRIVAKVSKPLNPLLKEYFCSPCAPWHFL